MVASSLTEGIGVLMLVPALELLTQSGSTTVITSLVAHVAAVINLPLTLGTLLSAFVALIALRAGLMVARDRLSISTQAMAVDRLRMLCLRSLMDAQWQWLVKQKRADHAALITMEITRIGSGLQALVFLTTSLTGLFVYLITAYALSPEMSLLAFGTGVLIYISLHRIRKKTTTLGQDLSHAHRSLMATVERSLCGLKLAKILGAEDRHIRDLEKQSATCASPN